jgi:hypothetical protein
LRGRSLLRAWRQLQWCRCVLALAGVRSWLRRGNRQQAAGTPGQQAHARREQLGPLLRAIVDEPIPSARTVRSAVPRDLEIICQRALDKSAASRYTSVGAFAEDLQRWLDGRPIHARPVGTAERMWRWAQRHPLSATLACLLVLVSLGGGALLAISHRARGVALAEARQRLHRSLIDQARALRFLAAPGHRAAALDLLKQAAALAPTAEIRGEAAALFAQPDVTGVAATVESMAPLAPDWPTELSGGDPASDRRVARSGERVPQLPRRAGRVPRRIHGYRKRIAVALSGRRERAHTGLLCRGAQADGSTGVLPGRPADHGVRPGDPEGCGFAASRVEYVMQDGGKRTVVVHFGADLLMRRVYRPTEWNHRISV